MRVFVGLILVVIMSASVDAAWISYTTNKGNIVTQQQTITQKRQTLSSQNVPKSLNPTEIELIKFVDNTEILPGGTITYIIIATNQGTKSVTDISFIDAIPSYTTFLDAGGLGTITYCHNGRGTNFDDDKSLPITHVRWELGKISPSGTATFILKVKVK